MTFVLSSAIYRWFQGGTLADYLLCRRYVWTYTSSPNYQDPKFPRCVEPDTKNLEQARLARIGRGHGNRPSLRLTTLRRQPTNLADDAHILRAESA